MKNLFLHLRLNMSLVLAPIFLWGFMLSQGNLSFNVLLGFISFHIFLYGGSNAYNSYYDKDEGPIGGLKNPPKVTDTLLYFSLACKFIGLLIAYYINHNFFIVYFIFFILSIVYSYKSTRWKANPFLSILTVGLGQGGLAFIGGWFSATQNIDNYPIFIFGVLTTIFMSLGVYPLTQLYQIEEDKRRNDITFAVYWGIKKSFIFSLICVIISAISMLTVIYIRKSYIDFILIFGFYLVFITQLYVWSKKYDEQDIMKNYDKIMKFNYSNGLGFSAYTILHILKIL